MQIQPILDFQPGTKDSHHNEVPTLRESKKMGKTLESYVYSLEFQVKSLAS